MTWGTFGGGGQWEEALWEELMGMFSLESQAQPHSSAPGNVGSAHSISVVTAGTRPSASKSHREDVVAAGRPLRSDSPRRWLRRPPCARAHAVAPRGPWLE